MFLFRKNTDLYHLAVDYKNGIHVKVNKMANHILEELRKYFHLNSSILLIKV